MEEKTTHHSPPQNDSYLREIRDAVVGIHDMLQKEQSKTNDCMDTCEARKKRHQKLVDIYVCNNEVLKILGIGRTTLYTWRQSGCLHYKRKGSRLILYSFIEIMEALADRRLVARNFNSAVGYKRMLDWYESNVAKVNPE